MKKIYVIGAGVSGLTAGIFAQMSGFDVTILEQHTIPGGFCTSWKRQGYLFEGGIHWLTGSSKEEPINRIWRATGALGNVEIINDDPFMVCYGGGEPISLHRNIDRFHEHLLEASPEDAPQIWRLISDIRSMMSLRMPVMNVSGVKMEKKSGKFSVGGMVKMVPSFMRMGSLLKISCKEYATRFKHPGIRGMIANLTSESYYAMAVISTMATLMRGDGGYPAGGSLPMTRRMADTFEKAGGRIEYRARAEEVVLEGGRTVGVKLGGETLPCDAVIVASDTLSAVDNLFKPALTGGWIDDMRKHTKPVRNVFLALGINGKLVGLPHSLFFPLEKPLRAAGQDLTAVSVYNYADYPGHAPVGCTALTCFCTGDGGYDFWRQAREEGRYEEEKKNYAETMIAALEEKLPQIRGRVDVWDVATPLTYERYTGSYQGSWMSIVTPGMKQATYPGTVDGARGLFFAGQRQMPPGGLPVALTTGRRAAQQVCKEFGVVYKGE